MSKKKNILHVLSYFHPDFAGGGVFLERLSISMKTINRDVTHDVLVTYTPRPYHTINDTIGIENIFYLSYLRLSQHNIALNLFRWIFLRVHAYDIVHFHTHVDRYFVSYWVTRLLGKKLILSATLDDSVPGILLTYKPHLRPLVRSLIKAFHRFLSISPKLQSETASYVGAGTSLLIPIGIPYPDLDKARRTGNRAKMGIGNDDVVLIFLGGICERKDPLFLIENMPYLVAKYPNIRLLIVGPVVEVRYNDKLQRAVKEGGMDEYVVFCGKTSDPYAYLEMSDIMVFASRLEGFGTAVIEAMAHGLPVVVRHLPGVNDFFIQPDKTGYLFTQVSDYLEYVSNLIENDDLRETIGCAARDYVLKNFAMPQIAAKYLRLYHGLYMPRSETETMTASPSL